MIHIHVKIIQVILYTERKDRVMKIINYCRRQLYLHIVLTKKSY